MSKTAANNTLNGKLTKESARVRAYADRRLVPIGNQNSSIEQKEKR